MAILLLPGTSMNIINTPAALRGPAFASCQTVWLAGNAAHRRSGAIAHVVYGSHLHRQPSSQTDSSISAPLVGIACRSASSSSSCGSHPAVLSTRPRQRGWSTACASGNGGDGDGGGLDSAALGPDRLKLYASLIAVATIAALGLTYGSDVLQVSSSVVAGLLCVCNPVPNCMRRRSKPAAAFTWFVEALHGCIWAAPQHTGQRRPSPRAAPLPAPLRPAARELAFHFSIHDITTKRCAGLFVWRRP